jgi:phospholipid/cholesterol/gamma-HCH transport system substrate-binding protein
LTPGSRSAPKLADEATIPHTQISPTVQLDQILSTFDPATRHAFQVWMQQDGIALTGRGENLNAALAELFPFATNIESVLAVLNRDSSATSTLLRDTGAVFSSLSRSPAQLQGFIRNANATFAATAARDTALAATVRAFPPFLIQTRATIDRVAAFANNAKPLVDELRPAARQLSPALQELVKVAPELRNLDVYVGPLTRAARAGIPALINFLRANVPLLRRLKPYLGGVVPVINYINDYRREVAGFFANGSASTENSGAGATGTVSLHNLRISNPVNPEVLTTYQGRLDSSRGNPYMVPGGYTQLLAGLPVFGSYLCTNRPQPTIGSSIPPALATVLQSVYFTVRPGGPACKPQPPLAQKTTGQNQYFPHLTQLP